MIKDTEKFKKIVMKKSQEILKNYNISKNTNEKGHKWGERFEEDLAKSLSLEYNVKPKQKSRSFIDMWVNDVPINVKFGDYILGRPNICAINRFINYINDGNREYFILKVKISIDTNIKIDLKYFNLIHYVDYLSYNDGTGQLMLKEEEFYKDWDKIKNRKPLHIKKIIKILSLLYNKGYENNKKLRKKKKEKYNKLFEEMKNEYS